MSPIKIDNSPVKDRLRALGLSASIPRNQNCVLLEMIEDLTSQWGRAQALLSDRKSFIFCRLSRRSIQYAR
jgi:hypothetical protein